MTVTSPVASSGRAFKMYAGRLERLGIITFKDLLYHIPARYDDFSLRSKIARIQPGETITIEGTVDEIKNSYLNKFKTLQKAKISDETGTIDVTWFNQPFLTKYISAGDTITLSGKASEFGRKLQLQSPEYELTKPDVISLHTGRLVPIYPETRGVSSKWLRRQIFNALKEYSSQVEDFLPEPLLAKYHFPLLQDALQTIHFPKTLRDADNARKRLAFDELFLMQLRGFLRRKAWLQQSTGTALHTAPHQHEIDTFIHSLPFTLTTGQIKAVDDIFKDIAREQPMNRLLQGDVGSGKTVVSAIAMYAAYRNGFQSVLMAPTEILAEQHFKTINSLLFPFGVTTALVTGSHKMKAWTPFDVLVGTHAVLTEKITFEKLGIVVIDEQQRFGVTQRGIIRQKGSNPHLLTMTATPIPRTIALTMYGDLDVSYLGELPKGRKVIKTWLVPPEKRENAYGWIREEITKNASQVFIICPFIEESESMQTVKAAAKEYETLAKTIYPDLKLGLLHGKMKAKEKEQVLSDFRAGKYHILVATPVVEVGIDIPNATVILIEAADRFGLSQLHQLRGRVGRGGKQSYCLLFTESTSDMTLQRLKAMETSHVGAELAELDLRLRGPGEMYGTKQSGNQELKIASFSDLTLIEQARNEASIVADHMEKYPEISSLINEKFETTISPD